MSDRAKMPEECCSMEDVRAGVNETDRALLALLERRYGYMRAAARIKTTRDAVRDEARKAAVIEAMRNGADKAGLPSADVAAIWNDLVESSISYELVEWDRLRQK